MSIVTLDFETYWDDQHSLTKMLPMTYVMHPKTQIISCSIKLGGFTSLVYFGEAEIRQAFKDLQPVIERSLLLGHNMSGFDAMIAAWRFGLKPKMWGCTLAMARPLHAVSVGGSLDKLAAHYGLGGKDNSALIATKGKRLEDFTPQEIADMEIYNRGDTDKCYGIFQQMRQHFSPLEMWQIDANIRQLIEPQFVLNRELLDGALNKERARKRESIMKVAEKLDVFGTSEEEIAEEVRSLLASAPRFAKFLESEGVEVPMKASPATPGKLIPALAKTDEAFQALTESDNEVVAAAAQARLAVKSTLLETRIEAFKEVADSCGGMLPVPIHYCGAYTTGRDSGWAYNPQNLPRVDPSKPKLSDALRLSMAVKPGDAVAVADLSGIELRVNMFLWKVPYAMALFQADPAKADLYKELASEVLGVPKANMPKMVRQAGKAMHLGCGFGLGSAAKYRAVARQMAQIEVTEDEAKVHIAGYRMKHPEIVKGWKTCHTALDYINRGESVAIDPWGLCWTCKEGIKLPSGRLIRYPNLRKRFTDGKWEWVYGNGRHETRIYAGKVTENIVQALARDILKGYKAQIFVETGRRTALDVHDELVYVVPEPIAHDHLAKVQEIMRTPPVWWPELITWSEGDVATTYGAAK